MTREYDDNERPSWRDIDKRREKSSHVSQEKKEKKQKEGADRWNTGRQKKALDKLFKGDKGTLEHEKLYNKIHKSYGSSAFLPAVQKYVEKYGPPDDPSSLILCLDSKDVDVMMLTMEKLREVYPRVSSREKEDIRRKLSILALTDKSPDVQEMASEIGDELKALPG